MSYYKQSQHKESFGMMHHKVTTKDKHYYIFTASYIALTTIMIDWA